MKEEDAQVLVLDQKVSGENTHTHSHNTLAQFSILLNCKIKDDGIQE